MSNNLTPAEIAKLMAPDNHPDPVSAAELEALIAPLSNAQLDELVELMGLGDLARQLPPLLGRIMTSAQRIVRNRPPEYDDHIDSIIRNMRVVDIDENPPTPPPPVSPELPHVVYIDDDPPTPPPASPEPPQTPEKKRVTRSTPSTPRTKGYDVVSPTKTGRAGTWFEAGALTQGVRGAAVRAAAGGTLSARRNKRSGAYGVFFGGEVGVFEKWSDTQRATTGHGLAIYHGFIDPTSAHAALAFARSKGWTGDSSAPSTAPTQSASPLPFATSYNENPLNSGTTKNLWYAVCRGVVPGIYRSYLECALNTCGVKGNLSCAFDTREEAEAALLAAYNDGYVRAIARPRPL
ncbi:hypothetical protein C8R47DRAFT_1224966 [Mycena vitilis]|nr:hypothetical protein C8R47DRAFT_1224966 [Mycena vitilis]